MIVYDVEQGSEEWLKLRLGRPTASEFSRIITPKKRKFSDGADSYINQLIGESMALHYPVGAPSYTSRAMEWGNETEGEARRWFAMETGLEVRQVGFITTDDGRFGASPDGLVGTDAGLELKCPNPETQVRYLREGVCPAEYLPQVHGGLVVGSGTLTHWWFLSYCPGLPPFKLRVDPDEFTTELRVCLEMFHAKYQEVLLKVKGM